MRRRHPVIFNTGSNNSANFMTRSFLSILFLTFLPHKSQCLSLHLYKGDENSKPIIEYDGKEDDHPSFLFSSENGPRIVQFYSPHCGHCQNFKPKYIKLAKEVNEMSNGVEIPFYAISCAVHQSICKQAEVRGYPTIKAFRNGSVEGQKLNTFILSAKYMIESLGSLKAKKKNGTNANQDSISRALNSSLVKYLYKDDANASSVMEYDNETNSLPSFLYSSNNSARIVQFYDSSNEPSQRFKPKYIQLANETKEKYPNAEIEFYAVSCSAHTALCNNNEIHTYPTVKAYQSGSKDGETLKDTHNLDAERIGHKLVLPSESNKTTNQKTNPHFNVKNNPSPKQPIPEQATIEYERSQENIFADAALSFHFSLKTGIYMSNGPLSDERQKAFREWIELLHRVLPPELKLKPLISDIRRNMDSVIQNEEHLSAIVTNYSPPTSDWSPSCKKNKEYAGYTCGLWELFHLMSIGVVEYNGQCLPKDRISTMRAADALRNFVSNFFGCSVCQADFLTKYDSCSFGRCDRLTAGSSSLISWKELPLWLWEVHNDVNVRLMKEEAERQKKEVGKIDEDRARWPLRHSCYRCWHDDGSWDERLVYDFLWKEYWPSGAVNLEDSRLLGDSFVKKTNQMDNRIFVPLLILGMIAIWWMTKKWKLEMSGRHKKMDLP